jgi:hypothetical protein
MPEAVIDDIIAAIAAICDLVVVLDPNYTPLVNEGVAIIQLMAEATLTVIGRLLTTHGSYSVGEGDEVILFGSAQLFDTREARCRNGAYPFVPATNGTSFPPLADEVSDDLVEVPVEDQILPCYAFACETGFTGESCSTPIEDEDDTPKLGTPEIVGISVGATVVLVLIASTVMYGVQKRRTYRYAPVGDGNAGLMGA